MTIGILGNFNKKEFYNIFNEVSDFLLSKNIKFYLLKNNILNKSKIQYKESISDYTLIKNKCDIILSIGGDGTIISTLRKFIKTNLPVLGLHIGGLGFLAECNRDSYKAKIQDIIDGKYHIEDRMVIEVESNKLSHKFYSINEVVINRGDSARTVKINIKISDKYVNTYESDGLIFSTPTGSTAYSLSAGGPIVSPSLELIIITPICPHTLSMRPLIVPSDKLIQISFEKQSNESLLSLNIDGQIQETIKNNSKIIISKSKYFSKIIKFDDQDYYKTLRNKMNWKGNLRFK